MSGVSRLFESSTFWSGLLAMLAAIVSAMLGVDVDPTLLAVVPLAVGAKEAVRHHANGVALAASARAAAFTQAAERISDPPSSPLPSAAQAVSATVRARLGELGPGASRYARPES